MSWLALPFAIICAKQKMPRIVCVVLQILKMVNSNGAIKPGEWRGMVNTNEGAFNEMPY